MSQLRKLLEEEYRTLDDFPRHEKVLQSMIIRHSMLDACTVCYHYKSKFKIRFFIWKYQPILILTICSKEEAKRNIRSFSDPSSN